MLSNSAFTLYLIVCVISVTVGHRENTACIPNKLIILSNCSFIHPYSNMTNDNRTLSMVILHSLKVDNNSDSIETKYLKIISHHNSKKLLIQFDLNIIQCSNKNDFNWTSVESSSTLRGEFVRTIFTDSNVMYLSSGITYLRNLTSINCLTKTIYRTDSRELFHVDFKIESTLNDYCSIEQSCHPKYIYQCDYKQNHCTCRSPFQSYVTENQQSICIHAVKHLDQCGLGDVRCLEWCHQNSSSNVCICPNEISIKKYSNDSHAYCEGRTNEICNSYIQCPLGDVCVQGTCLNMNRKLQQFMSFDTMTISIIVTTFIFMIIIILTLCIYLLRRQRWKKRYHSSIDSVYKKRQQQQQQQQQQSKHVPAACDYDNVIYETFRNNVQFPSDLLSSHDNDLHDTLPFTTSDSSSYHPKVVLLGGAQQLTAIYA